MPARIEVESNLEGEGIEIAVLDAPAGARLTLSLESKQDFDQPGKARLRVMRYDAPAADDRVAARLAALRAWCAATGTQTTGDDHHRTAFHALDLALAHFESPAGEPALAAWGRLVRARFNHRQLTGMKVALADTQRAERGFTSLGAERNAARARLLRSAVLIETAHDRTAKDPGPEEAARQARQLLLALSTDSSLSPLEQTRALNYLGVLAFYVHEIPEARARFRAVIQAFEAQGNHHGRLVALANVAAVAAEEGDYRGATQYFDRIIADLDRAGPSETRATLLFNAARLDTTAGNVDRAIERLLRALELAREDELPQNEARFLHGLGMAYWVRGDMAQAAAFLGEALKLRRTLNDPLGLSASLGANGSLARDTGDMPKALAMHREAVTLAATADRRLRALLDLALDYQAVSDFPRAIATAREALLPDVGIPDYYPRYAVQLALADMLLTQPRRTPQSMGEATELAQGSLQAAIQRGDITQEIAGRRVLAQSHAARGATREARAEYEKAIALIFNYRSTIYNPELRAVTLAHEQQTFRGYVDLLMRDVAQRGPGKLLPVSRAEEDALRTLEGARAVNFVSTGVSQLDPATRARVDELLERMAGKRVRIAALLERSDDVARELERLRLDMAQLRTEVDRLRTTAARTAKVADELPTVDAPWPGLPEATTQLSYALETEHPYLWVRDATGIRATALAATRASIARDLAALADATRARSPRDIDERLSRLSGTLLPSGVFAGNPTTLEIVAEGQIVRIPFAALDAGQGTRIMERQSIVMIHSLFKARPAAQAARAHPLGFVAVANLARSPGGTPAALVFPALQSANAEVNSIATLFERRDPPATTRLLLGDEGSAGNLRNAWQGGIGVIHFATHGLADLRQPMSSLLLLPARDAAGSPTYLTAGQVQEWRGDADLVYLSACETAVGPARFADGLPGLQRAFLRAGARAVIATLWPVEDMYASQFATDFYLRYTTGRYSTGRNTTGTSASQALSETQRAWMEPVRGVRASELAYRRMAAWAHVFYAQ